MNAITWALLAALLWGIAPILEKTGLKSIPVFAGLFYRCVGVIVGMVVLVLFFVKPHEIRSVGARSALLLVLGGFLASVMAQMCFYKSLKLGDVSRVVPISGSYPVIAFCLGVLLLGEALTPLKAMGMLFVVGGVWLLRF